MKSQLVNKKAIEEYLKGHQLEEGFEDYIEDHKPAEITLEILNESKLMYRISQLNMQKKASKGKSDHGSEE
jgi:hypothetical protein